MLNHLRLNKDCGAIGIEARGEPVHGVVQDVRANIVRGFVVGCERVPVHDAMKALVLVLQLDPVVESSDKVTEMKAARWPHATENSWFAHVGLETAQDVLQKGNRRIEEIRRNSRN